MAVGMRVSQAVGEGRHAAVGRIGFGAAGMACAGMSVSAVGFWIAGPALAGGFVKDPEVILVAARLLGVAAIFQLFDGVQVVGGGALRGLADVRVPAVITFGAYWLLAIPAAYGLGLHTRLGAAGVWIGLAAGLAAAAVALMVRFGRLSRPRAVAGLRGV